MHIERIGSNQKLQHKESTYLNAVITVYSSHEILRIIDGNALIHYKVNGLVTKKEIVYFISLVMN